MPDLIFLQESDWPKDAANIVSRKVWDCLSLRGTCNVMLTGGRSAELLYKAWSALPNFNRLHNVIFYFGDERSVLPSSSESNYKLAMSTLFVNGVPANCKVIRIRAEESNLLAVAEDYETQLQARIDLLLLSIGEDGHIASLFPFDSALYEVERFFLPVKSPKPPSNRITITPALIRSARDILILALGKKKLALYDELLRFPSAYNFLPARLVLHGTWVFGD